MEVYLPCAERVGEFDPGLGRGCVQIAEVEEVGPPVGGRIQRPWAADGRFGQFRRVKDSALKGLPQSPLESGHERRRRALDAEAPVGRRAQNGRGARQFGHVGRYVPRQRAGLNRQVSLIEDHLPERQLVHGALDRHDIHHDEVRPLAHFDLRSRPLRAERHRQPIAVALHR